MFVQRFASNARRSALALSSAALFASLTVQAHDHMGKTDQAKADIVETAQASGDFDTLVTALQAAGLVETLQGAGPFTVFAPTDAAFEKIPEADLEALLADKDKLTDVLTYHVVSGKVMAEDVAGMKTAATVQGDSLEIDTSNGVMVDQAKVTQADIETSNGVIHAIDSVLMPGM